MSAVVPHRLFAQLDAHTESNFFSGFSGDLRDGGLFVATYTALEVGAEVEVELSLPGPHFVCVRGSVAWQRTPAHGRRELSPGVGIALHALSDEQAELFATFMGLREPTFVDPDVLSLDAHMRSNAVSRPPEPPSAPAPESEPEAPQARRRPKRGRKRGRR